ncbi:MAG TPA: DinB family protein [Bryobacteraceae bacterium]
MTHETAKSLSDFILPQIEQESATTRKILASIPAETCQYKPSEKCMSALELATHIAASEAFFLNGVLNGSFEWKQPDLKTPAEVLAFYDASVAPLIAQVRDLSGEKLAQPIAFATWSDPGVLYLNLHLKHSIHHRGQLSAYLRPMGSKVPSIYGPSGDEEKSAQA